MKRSYFLSFCDGRRPKGEQFLGACVVDVEALGLDEREWMQAAVEVSHKIKCNPGGEVQITRVDEADNQELLASVPRGFLMDRAELERRGI